MTSLKSRFSWGKVAVEITFFFRIQSPHNCQPSELKVSIKLFSLENFRSINSLMLAGRENFNIIFKVERLFFSNGNFKKITGQNQSVRIRNNTHKININFSVLFAARVSVVESILAGTVRPTGGASHNVIFIQIRCQRSVLDISTSTQELKKPLEYPKGVLQSSTILSRLSYEFPQSCFKPFAGRCEHIFFFVLKTSWKNRNEMCNFFSLYR